MLQLADIESKGVSMVAHYRIGVNMRFNEFKLTKTFDNSEEPKEEVKEEIKSESNVFDIHDDDDGDEEDFGLAIVPDIDCEVIEKKKETIDDLEKNLLEQLNEENTKEKLDVDVEDTNKQAAPDQKTNKKKRGKKK